MPAQKFARNKPQVYERREIRERLALRNEVKSEKHSGDMRENERRDRNEKVWPDELRENADTSISCR